MLGPDDVLPARPSRILVAGGSGAGKTTLAGVIGTALGVPHVELDALFHGPGWVPRPSFADDVRRFVDTPDWVTEWQYDEVRELLAARAQLVVWLDLARPRVLQQVVLRTARRRLRGTVLWNGNVEPALWRIAVDPEHVVRWAWSSYPDTQARVLSLCERRPELPVVRLRTRSAVTRWTTGPLAAAATGPQEA